MTQKTADPAPANEKRGNEQRPTAAYCWAKLNSLPKLENRLQRVTCHKKIKIFRNYPQKILQICECFFHIMFYSIS